MKSRDFIYWLQGGFELGKLKSIDEETTKVIQNHIEMVFIEEIDPSFGADKQEALQNAHDGITETIQRIRDNGFKPGTRMKC